jgi:hypothetical protein
MNRIQHNIRVNVIRGKWSYGIGQGNARDEYKASSNHSFVRGTNVGRGRWGGYTII